MDEKELYRNILQNIYDGVYFVDKERKITFWNKAAERITGFSASEVLNKFCYDNILKHVNEYGCELCKNGCPLHETLKDGSMRETIVYLQHKKGHRIPVHIQSIAIKHNQEILGAVEIFKDNSEQNSILKQIEDLKILALKDQLTGLPNRRYIDSFLDLKMKEFLSFEIPFGIAFLDLDRFKNVNDLYGHDIGDEVLKMVAQTCSSIVRSSDLIGRWGGEEFLGIFSGVNTDSLRKVSEKIRMLVEKASICRGDKDLKVTISIGATLFRQNDTIATAIKRADQLLYQSKEDGRNRVTLG